MFAFHYDRKRYFDMQYRVTTDTILPLIEKSLNIRPGFRVLEVGCGEGGVLKAFARRGCTCVGVDHDAARIENGSRWMREEGDNVLLLADDIFRVPVEALGGTFDLIILKDVIEHIHNKRLLLGFLGTLLKPWGQVFFAFPPWQMPFGGHQQMCSSALSKLPWLHLLPRPLYKYILKKKGEPWEALLDIRDTRISIEGFRRLARRSGFAVVQDEPFLLNPIYAYKFGWRARRQSVLLKHLPYLRNYVTTCAYFLVRKKALVTQMRPEASWQQQVAISGKVAGSAS